LVDVQDAREEYDDDRLDGDVAFDQMSFEHRVQLVRAYIANDNYRSGRGVDKLSDRDFNRVREAVADEYRPKVKPGSGAGAGA
ncbi:hypothetical protein ACI3PL_28270, partial [Lacticaseibacillus paracasei]